GLCCAPERPPVARCPPHLQMPLRRCLSRSAALRRLHSAAHPRTAPARTRAGSTAYRPFGGWNSHATRFPKKVFIGSARRLRTCTPQSSSNPSLMEYVSLLRVALVFLCALCVLCSKWVFGFQPQRFTEKISTWKPSPS